jgi:hypothetical protein
MRALFGISVALVALFVIDAIGFGGKLRNTAWTDLRFQAHRLNDEWKGSMRPPAQKSASHPARRTLFRPVRLRASH